MELYTLEPRVNFMVLEVEIDLPYERFDRFASKDISVDILVYEAVFKPNFVTSWMEPVRQSCKSNRAIWVTDDNLKCEKDPGNDHRQMLERFANQVRYPSYESVTLNVADAMTLCQPLIDEMTAICHHTSAVDGLLLLACLENASIPFIRYMSRLADRLSLKDRTYLDVHGVADLEHARGFIQAVVAEAKLTGVMPSERPMELVKELLHQIFHAHTCPFISSTT